MQDQLDKMEKSINRIEDALVGNAFGNPGIVNRLKGVEKKAHCNTKELNSSKNTSILYGTGAGGLLIGIVEAVKAIFTH